MPHGSGQAGRRARCPGCPSYPSCSSEDLAMRTFDFAPLSRSTIGFDRLFDLFDESLRHTPDEGYPPYNIERTGDDAYRITLALAGFGADDVTVTAEQNTLTVEGRKLGQGQREYVYQGIAARPFRRLFNLADYVEVKQASFQDG